MSDTGSEYSDGIPPSGQSKAIHGSVAEDAYNSSGSNYAPSSEGRGGSPEQLIRHPSNLGWHSRTAGERRNRFQGRAVQWRKFTETERHVATSLDNERSRNLSVHLYNAYVLQRRQSRKGSAWQPPSLWTAWPMPPDEVPRPNEMTHVTFTPREHPLLSSRQELEEILVATTTQQARKRFNERQAILLQTPKKRPRGWYVRLYDSDIATPSAVETHEREASVQTTSSTNLSEKLEFLASDTDRKDVFDGSKLRKRRRKTQQLHRGGSLAVPSSDQDHASRILQPTVRDVLEKLDTVFMALHRSRLTHMNSHVKSQRMIRNEEKRSKSVSTQGSSQRTSQEGTRSQSRGRRQSQTINQTLRSLSRHTSNSLHVPFEFQDDESIVRSHSSKASGYQEAEEDEEEGWEEDDDEEPPDTAVDAANSARQVRKTQERRSRLGLRDWSEVLGMAAISGAFPPQVIENARRRCADLFQEDMGLSILEPELGNDTPFLSSGKQVARVSSEEVQGDKDPPQMEKKQGKGKENKKEKGKGKERGKGNKREKLKQEYESADDI